MRESKLITCFFVNEGEEIMELSVDNPSALSGEIYPGKVLKKKEPGWLKFGFEEGCVPGRISFILKCKDANGKTARGLLMIDEDAKRISSE
jgi:hypothetical protein